MTSSIIQPLNNIISITQTDTIIRRKKHIPPQKELLTYKDFFKKKVELKKYKIPELKLLAKHYKLHVTGRKPVLIERIEGLFVKMINAVKIQSIVRGFFVRLSVKLRGLAFKNIPICINETDFYTLEPLRDIPFELFYSYTDASHFTYGFNINSLVTLYKKKGKIVNPYNREEFTCENTRKLYSLYRLVNILFLNILEENTNDTNSACYVSPVVSAPSAARQINLIRPNYLTTQPPSATEHSRPLPASLTAMHSGSNQEVPATLDNLNISQFNAHLHSGVSIESIRRSLAIISQVRAKPLHQRIIELFMEIDQLGNYTDPSWFLQLDKPELYRYLNILIDLWRYRARINQDTKRHICPLGEPYSGFLSLRERVNDTPVIKYQEGCICIMENMVLTGINTDSRCLGALHVLTALTIVSYRARDSMIWLYEGAAIVD
jgi:hypothetical protein